MSSYKQTHTVWRDTPPRITSMSNHRVARFRSAPITPNHLCLAELQAQRPMRKRRRFPKQ